MGYRLGVDLGTTYTAAAVAVDGRLEILALGNRAMQVPSVLFFPEDGAVLVGEAAERRGASEPARVAREFKRRIGDSVPILLGGAPFSPQAITARLLTWVVAAATERQGGPPDRISVTYPANWGPFKRDLLQQAITLAGLRDVSTLTEPEAAAITYASRNRLDDGDRIVVYDLGGGTFDAAVLARDGGGFRLLGTPEGVEHLGGIDFDDAVFHHVFSSLGPAVDGLDERDPATVVALARLRRDCVEAKEALSADTETVIPVVLPGINQPVRLTRGEFEDMIRPSIADTVASVQRVLESAQTEPSQLAAIVLVGGSSRIPLVAEELSEAFDRPVALDTHPKHDIALGAAAGAAGVAAPGVGELDSAARPAPPAAVPEPRIGVRGRKTAQKAPDVAPQPARVASAPRAAVPSAPAPAHPVPAPTPVSEPARAAATREIPADTTTTAPLGLEPPPPPPRARLQRGWLWAAGGVAAVIVAVVSVLQFGGSPESAARGPGSPSAGPSTAQSPTTTTSPTPSPTPDPSAVLPRSAAPLPDDVIVVPRSRAGNWDIATFTTGGKPVRQLTASPAEDSFPVISADRRTVIYLHRLSPTTQELRVIGADGSGDRRLFPTPPSGCADLTRPAFGTTLQLVLPCIAPTTKKVTLKLVSLDGKLIRDLDSGWLGDPAFTQDATSVLYWRNDRIRQDGGAIYQVAVNGSTRPQPITAGGAIRDNDADASPVGDLVAISRLGKNPLGVWTVSLSGGHPLRQLTTKAGDQDPTWSPDGKQIAFKRDGRLWVMDANGKNARRITTGQDSDTAAAWNPR